MNLTEIFVGIYALDKRVPTFATWDRVATIMTSFQQPSWNLKLKKREWSGLGSLARLSHPTPTSKCPIMQLWELIIEWNDVWNWKHLKCIVLVPTRSKLYRRWRRIRILSEKQPAIQTRWHPAKLWKYPRFTICVYCCSTSHKWKQICRVSIDLPRWICRENLYMR